MKAFLLVVLVSLLAACSFKLEIGYHGQTGIADHTETALATKGK